MIASRSDRSKISTLYGAESGSGSWKKPPTAIQVPSNVTNMSSNPFSAIGNANVGKAKANNNRPRESVTSRMKSKQGKMSEPGIFQGSNIQKKRTLLSSGETKWSRTSEGGSHQSSLLSGPGKRETIDLSDADDVFEVTPQSGFHSQGPVAGPSRLSSSGKKGPRHFELAEDGPHMQRLNRTYLVEDDIENASRSPTPPKEQDRPPETIKPATKVRNMVQNIEKMSKLPDAPPKEDLRMHLKKPPSRSQFGPNVALNSVASSSTPSSSEISPKAQGKKRKRKGFYLPFHRLFKATPPTIINFPSSEASVTWSGNHLRVLDGTGSELCLIDRQNYKFITCTFYRPESPQMLVRFENPDIICQEQPSDVIIWFNLDQIEEADYRELFGWVSAHKRIRWDTVSGFWDWAEAQVKGASTLSRVLQSNRQASVTVSDVDSVAIADKPRQPKPGPSTHNLSSRSTTRRPLLGPSKDSISTHQSGGQGSTSKAVPNTAIPHKAAKTELAAPLRRSTRQSTGNSDSVTQPPGDADEVILVYPPDVPGKVNITRGDVARLQPGEFLNDTLIEFGLKLWLRDLEEKNPELAKQVHVFSSFFYKKLNKRDLAEGYSSVRKWTAKFNLFEKKYIIVPINERMHWYLAIIYEPEHVLSPPDPAIPIPPSPSISTNREEATDSKTASEVQDPASPLHVDDEDPDHIKDMTSSECGIEEDLTNLTQACSISSDADLADEKAGAEEDADAMNIDEPATKTKCKSPAPDEPIVIDGETSGAVPTSPMRYSPELPEIISRSKNPSTTASKTPSTNGDEADDLNLVSEDVPVIVAEGDPGIDSSSFYASTNTRSGKQYGKPKPKPVPKPRRSNAPPDTQVSNRTYVLTLDSLGTGHKHAARVLATYLRHEAKDKKGVESEAPIDSRQVHVPTQPNFCDCGIYLLHLAQTFISNTTFYMDQVFATTPKTPNSARQTLWKDDEVPLMREGLKKRILELSKDWKQAQPEKPSSSKVKDQKPTVVDEPSSDSDIDIIEHTVPSAKGRGKNKQSAAARIR